MPAASERSNVRILIIDDDPAFSEALHDALTQTGYQAYFAKDGATAETKREKLRPDLVILELVLPDVDGLLLCSSLTSAAAPVIVCSRTNRQRDSILARRLGAAEFIAKPCDIDKLAARVAAVLRRSGASPASRTEQPVVRRIGALEIGRSRAAVTIGGRNVRLTPVQYRLVVAFDRRINEPIARAELGRIVWGYWDESMTQTLTVQVGRLNRVLGGVAGTPRLVAVRGVGYKMVRDGSSLGAAVRRVARLRQ